MKINIFSNKGQSLIESVFAVGLIVLVMTGVVSLLINMVGSRSKSYDRSKAVELSQIVMEEIIKTESLDKASFWDTTSIYWMNLSNTQTNASFPDYSYTAEVSQYTLNGCSNVVTNCVNVSLNIRWKNGNTNDNFNRFFSKK